ncbi:MAG: hypothetical protein HY779_01840 [Rubrobacteridae bacterium]|nr:hypothetical protein [Rubrobacteridae bacterium]
MFNVAAYIGLIISIFAASCLLVQASIVSRHKRKNAAIQTGSIEYPKDSIDTEIKLSYLIASIFFVSFLLMLSMGWAMSLLVKISPFSSDVLRELSPFMIIVSGLIGISLLRFRRKLVVAGLYAFTMILFLLFYGVQRAESFDFYYLDWEVFRVALSYAKNDTIFLASLVGAPITMIVLALVFQIPRMMREAAATLEHEDISKTRRIRFSAMIALTIAFIMPMLDLMNPSEIPCDPPNALLWGGCQIASVSKDGKKVYYLQSRGSDERVNSGHTPVFKLFRANIGKKPDGRIVRVPGLLSLTGGYLSPSGKCLLANYYDNTRDNNTYLAVINSESYKIENRIKVDEGSSYGWLGTDDEIWLSLSKAGETSGTIAICDFKTNVVQDTDIKQPMGIFWSADYKHALWLNNFADDDPNTILLYDRASNKSTTVAAAETNDEMILCTALSNDSATIYFVTRKGEGVKSRLNLWSKKIGSGQNQIVLPLDFASHVNQLKPTKDGKRLLFDGYFDSDSFYNEHFIYNLDLPSGKATKLVSNKKYGFSWEYDAAGNKIVWNDNYRPEFQEKLLD